MDIDVAKIEKGTKEREKAVAIVKYLSKRYKSRYKRILIKHLKWTVFDLSEKDNYITTFRIIGRIIPYIEYYITRTTIRNIQEVDKENVNNNEYYIYEKKFAGL